MTKVIAEIGVNWSGDFNKAQQMIESSKEAGADGVKFQLFNKEVINNSIHYEALSEMILTKNNIAFLSDQAKNNNLKFGISVMYPDGFETLDRLSYDSIDFIKIRCKDYANEEIAKPAVKFCNSHNIPLLISTERYLLRSDYFKYVLYNTIHANYLYCIPKYPPLGSDFRLECVNPSYFNGYSNHYPYKIYPIMAITRGLEWIEVHVNLDKNTKAIDKAVSLSFRDLNDICYVKDLMNRIS